MKVYFNFSGRSSEEIIDYCRKIYKSLEDNNLTHTFNCFEDFSPSKISSDDYDVERLYKKCIKAISKSNIVVLELTTNSFTQGFILQRALELNKPVIALFKNKSSSVFIEGIKNDLLQLVEYDEYNLNRNLKNAIIYAKEKSECRFNFYLNYDILNYLKYISKKHNKSKSAFIRDALEEMMLKDAEYLH